MEKARVSFGMRLTSEKKEEIHRESTFRGTRGTPLGKKGGKGRTKGSSIVYSDVGWCRREEQRRRVAENSTVR